MISFFLAHNKSQFLIGKSQVGNKRQNRVYQWALFFGLLTLVSVGLPAGNSAATIPLTGSISNFQASEDPQSPPDDAFIGSDGKPIKFNDFKGKITLVNFWAIWCAPCVRELPSLDRLQAEMGSDDFQVRLISIDRKGAEVYEPFLEKLGIKALRSESDPGGKIARKMKIKGLPATLILNRDAKILGTYYGAAEWDSDEAKNLIRHFLNQKN